MACLYRRDACIMRKFVKNSMGLVPSIHKEPASFVYCCVKVLPPNRAGIMWMERFAQNQGNAVAWKVIYCDIGRL